MTAIPLSESGLKNAKRALINAFEGVKSMHLSEALAAACGYQSHAALLVDLAAQDPTDPDFVLLDDKAFIDRLGQLDPSIADMEDDGVGWFEFIRYPSPDEVIKTLAPRYYGEPYKGPRQHAWRNALVSAINAGIAQRHFTVRQGGNRWPGADDRGRGQQQIYRFEIDGIPAIAAAGNAGWDEVSIHVAFWPTDDADRWIVAGNAGFLAGELFAQGWLERRDGAWLQFSAKPLLWCRKAKLDRAAGLSVRPRGYADRGAFKM